MDKFSKRPPCALSWSLSASKVMAPRQPGSASSNMALVSCSSCCSLNSIPFSSMQARITCCSSRCWIRPSPETPKPSHIIRKIIISHFLQGTKSLSIKLVTGYFQLMFIIFVLGCFNVFLMKHNSCTRVLEEVLIQIINW